MTRWGATVDLLFRNYPTLLALLILLFGIFVGYLVMRIVRGMLVEIGVPGLVEGTVFERTARNLGTSTVGILSALAALFVYLGALILALATTRMLDPVVFWSQLTGYLPQLFVAALALIAGFVVGDKVKLLASERLRSVKLPELEIIPELLRYSVIYVAGLVALGQLGVVVEALLVLLAVYAFGLVFLGGLAFRDLLAAGAAGVYVLLTEPYSIGDEIRVDGMQGIVQEVNVFVTRIEGDGEEYVVPNRTMVRSSVVRVRG